MLEALQRPASASFEPLGGSPTHLDRLRDVEPAELDTQTTSSAAFTALARSLCTPSGSSSTQFISVPYVPQAASWDCGLACVAMCLRAFQIDAPSLAAFQQLFPTHSVWTIDLAYMLRSFGLHVEYHTLTLGANPDFSTESYYEQMKADLLRIQCLFEGAEQQGIIMAQKAVQDWDIQQHLEGGAHVIIVLVDKNTLAKGQYFWNESLDDALKTSSANYTGHYVVVCGYDKSSDSYMIRDPDPRAGALGLFYISRNLLNAARRVFGTDEDLLFISASKRPDQ